MFCARPSTRQKRSIYSDWLNRPKITPLVPIYWASETLVKWHVCIESKGHQKTTPTSATVCSPCCSLARDTEVSPAVPPDYRTDPWKNLFIFLALHKGTTTSTLSWTTTNILTLNLWGHGIPSNNCWCTLGKKTLHQLDGGVRRVKESSNLEYM